MCGIVGFSGSDKKLVQQMTKMLSHRGPDQSGVYVDDRVSLGHRRLSIIDLSEKGNQPLFNENHDICVIYNGEIYNFQSIREDLEGRGHRFSSNTDTEVIVHAYEEFGTTCLQRFNGAFALALYDSNKKELFLARDRLGIKPLYYYCKDGKFVFGSEIKALLLDKTIARTVNKDALNKFLTYRYIPEKQTIFEDIYRLLPGTYLLYSLKNKKLTISNYWDIPIAQLGIRKSSVRASAKKLSSLFEESVKKRMMSDVPLGAYLSGGLDSSAVVASMAKYTSQAVKTFAVAFEHDTIGNELPYAKKVSEYCNTDHKELYIKPNIVRELPQMVWYLDEPLSDPAIIPNYVLARFVKKDVSVILTGDGGDDIFAGYDQFKFPVFLNKMRFLPEMVRGQMLPALLRATPLYLLNKIYKYSSATGEKMFERFANVCKHSVKNPAKSYLEIVSVFNEDERKNLLNSLHGITDFSLHPSLNHNYFCNHADYLNKLLYLELKRYLPEDLLMKPDKMCMAHGVEIRVPFLDHQLVEYSFRLKPSLKLHGLTTKYIFKKAMAGQLPKDIIYRKKQTFQLPIGEWIEKELKPLFEEYLSKKTIERQGYFNYPHIRKIFNNYSSSKLYYGRQLWSLFNFQLWHSIFIEGVDPKKIKI